MGSLVFYKLDELIRNYVLSLLIYVLNILLK